MESKHTGSKPGRRPKKVKEEMNTIEHVETKEIKEKKTKKKTPPVVAMVSSTGIVGSFLSEQRPLIAHLPIKPEQIVFESTGMTGDELKYDPSIPDVPKPADGAYESYAYISNLSETDSILEHKKTESISGSSEVLPMKSRIPSHYSEKLMVQYQEANRLQKLPDKTDIACFWCCHSFTSPPCAIPAYILDEIWNMYGNFCSPECAVSYLFKEKIDIHVQYERYALLNTLYVNDCEIETGSSSGVRPAPPREVLRMFGGCMDIGEYRAIVHERKLRVDVISPPLVSIIQTMDTKPIDFYDQNLKNVFIKNDISHKYNLPGAQGLRLRRTKPLKSKEASVEWAMRITTIEE
jgi:hypothetical protein